MPELDKELGDRLALLEAKGQRRKLAVTERANGVSVTRGGKQYISFSCNDYLGLSADPRVIKASIDATQKYGAGAGASRLVTGNTPLYAELESEIAKMKGCEAALVFGSGYLANLGTIPALVGKPDLIVADKLVHACMIDAAKLSGTDLLRFAHNNLAHLEEILADNRNDYHQCLILTETVFSMDGDRAPLPEIAALAKRFNAWLMTDDAHGFGVISEVSAVARTSPERRPMEFSGENSGDIIKMGTLSKAVGSYGGYIAGSKKLIDYLQTSARSVIYTTGLPPATLAASIAALKIIQAEPELGKKAHANAQLFTSLTGLPDAQSAIVPLVLGEREKALSAAEILEKSGFLVAAIREPTVPPGTARLRFAFSALHQKEQIEKLVDAVKTIMQQTALESR